MDRLFYYDFGSGTSVLRERFCTCYFSRTFLDYNKIIQNIGRINTWTVRKSIFTLFIYICKLFSNLYLLWLYWWVPSTPSRLAKGFLRNSRTVSLEPSKTLCEIRWWLKPLSGTPWRSFLDSRTGGVYGTWDRRPLFQGTKGTNAKF